MNRVVYHGSDHIIEQPEYGKGMRNNDYGRGFYCTENLELAKEWACAKQKDGYANIYELDMAGLKVLNLNDPAYHILNWLALLAENRTYWQNGSIAQRAKRYTREHFLIDISGYDILVGYRADDSYFSFAQDFVSGAISLQKLSEAMRLGKLGEQVVLKSRLAFEKIHYVGNEPVSAKEYYQRKMLREKEARKEYRSTKKRTSYLEELFIIDIMREGMQNDDPRLR